MTSRLKLRAEDREDLKVIAACLQDALIPLSDIHYVDSERRLIMVANRFRWENCPDLPEAPSSHSDGVDCANYERVNCGLTGMSMVKPPSFVVIVCHGLAPGASSRTTPSAAKLMSRTTGCVATDLPSSFV